MRKKGGEGGKALRAPPRMPGGEGRGKGVCVVHEGPMVNPTVLPSGWVGCYKCVHGWVEEKGTCPVTGARVELGDLRKIVG